MHKNILLVDNNLLRSSTAAMMYEAYGCDVSTSTDVEDAVSVATIKQLDVVVMGESFSIEYGKQLRAAIKRIRPELCIAVIAEFAGSGAGIGEFAGADVRVSPMHFYTDLSRCASLPT